MRKVLNRRMYQRESKPLAAERNDTIRADTEMPALSLWLKHVSAEAMSTKALSAVRTMVKSQFTD